METRLIFTDASQIDAAEVAALVNQAYRGAGGEGGWTNEQALIKGPRTSEEGVLALIAGGRVVLMREMDGGAIVGCINVTVDEDGAWHTSMLAVNPDVQTAGAGKAIKQEIERQARAAGAKRMRMEVIGERTDLVAWHRRRGYVATGAVLPFPYDDPSVGQPLRPGLELILMEKDLTLPSDRIDQSS
jgi:GNAT superfamily N-acetyltransferase